MLRCPGGDDEYASGYVFVVDASQYSQTGEDVMRKSLASRVRWHNRNIAKLLRGMGWTGSLRLQGYFGVSVADWVGDLHRGGRYD